MADMGLIGAIVQTPWAGGTAVLMSPTTMLADPFIWLKACSDYKAAATAGMPQRLQNIFNADSCIYLRDE